MSLNDVIRGLTRIIDFFLGSTAFERSVRQLLSELGLRADSITEDVARVTLPSNDNGETTLLLINCDEVVKVLAVTELAFLRRQFPTDLSHALLERNAKAALGAWHVMESNGTQRVCLSYTLFAEQLNDSRQVGIVLTLLSNEFASLFGSASVSQLNW